MPDAGDETGENVVEERVSPAGGEVSVTPYFQFFNEIGILNQLSTALLEARLPRGLLAPHFSVLNHLVRVEDGRTPLAMARAFQIPKTTMTHQVGVLERHGLVESRPNPDDGRSKRVWLTREGRAFRERVIESFASDVGDLARVVPLPELTTVLPVLERLRRHMDEARNATDPPDRPE